MYAASVCRICAAAVLVRSQRAADESRSPSFPQRATDTWKYLIGVAVAASCCHCQHSYIAPTEDLPNNADRKYSVDIGGEVSAYPYVRACVLREFKRKNADVRQRERAVPEES